MCQALERGMVFCGTKRRCDFIDRKIKSMGLRSAGAIHGRGAAS
jgi:superfamily II DNA/RNA helicase